MEIEVARGKTAREAVKKFGVTEQTYLSLKEVGGLRIDQTKRLKRLLLDAKFDKATLPKVAE